LHTKCSDSREPLRVDAKGEHGATYKVFACRPAINLIAWRTVVVVGGAAASHSIFVANG